MSNINDIIGDNIRETRNVLGLSADSVSSLCEHFGLDISPATIRRYERGDQRIPGDDIVLLAAAMNCSTQQLINGTDPRTGFRKISGTHPIRNLTPNDNAIITNLATKWDGNIHILILAMAVYAFLPVEYRREIIMALMLQLDAAVRSGKVKLEDLPIDLMSLQQYVGGMY